MRAWTSSAQVASSDERMAVAKAIDASHDKFKGTADDVISTMDVLLELYGDVSDDTSSMLGIFRTNPGYRGLRCPMNQLPDGKWVPDFNNRYFCEDLPFGLVNFKSIALLVGVDTPFIDEIILWAQRHLDMELLVKDADDKYQLAGSDVNTHTTAVLWYPLHRRPRPAHLQARLRNSVKAVLFSIGDVFGRPRSVRAPF